MAYAVFLSRDRPRCWFKVALREAIVIFDKLMAYKLGKAGKAGKGTVAAAPKGGGKRSFESVADGTSLYCICVSVVLDLCRRCGAVAS